MRTLGDIVTQLQALQPDLRRRYPIRAMGIFGSYVRGEARDDSDLDVSVEIGEGMTPPDYVGLQMELTDALGIKVDLADKAALRRRIGAHVLAEVRMLRRRISAIISTICSITPGRRWHSLGY